MRTFSESEAELLVSWPISPLAIPVAVKSSVAFGASHRTIRTSVDFVAGVAGAILVWATDVEAFHPSLREVSEERRRVPNGKIDAHLLVLLLQLGDVASDEDLGTPKKLLLTPARADHEFVERPSLQIPAASLVSF